MKPEMNDEKLTAYVLGELEEEDLHNFLKVMQSLTTSPATRYLGLQG